jgi:hypothetical protein
MASECAPSEVLCECSALRIYELGFKKLEKITEIFLLCGILRQVIGLVLHNSGSIERSSLTSACAELSPFSLDSAFQVQWLLH